MRTNIDECSDGDFFEEINDSETISIPALKRLNDDNKQQVDRLLDNYRGFKTLLLPQWNKNVSKMVLDEEIRNQKITKCRESGSELPKTYFKKYHQGNIVFVNFGVNYGSEFSGGHYAVVLTSDDDKFSEKVIVCPIKTHKGKILNDQVDLGNSVSSLIFGHISDRLTEIEQKRELLNNLDNDITNVFSEIKQFIYTGEDFNTLEEAINDYFENNFKELDEEVIKKFHNDNIISKIDLSLDDRHRFLSVLKKVNKKIKLKDISLLTIINLVVKEQKKLSDLEMFYTKIKNTYNKLNNKTIALPKEISSVSKYRIKKRKNEMDPLGIVKLESTSTTSILNKWNSFVE